MVDLYQTILWQNMPHKTHKFSKSLGHKRKKTNISLRGSNTRISVKSLQQLLDNCWRQNAPPAAQAVAGHGWVYKPHDPELFICCAIITKAHTHKRARMAKPTAGCVEKETEVFQHFPFELSAYVNMRNLRTICWALKFINIHTLRSMREAWGSRIFFREAELA